MVTAPVVNRLGLPATMWFGPSRTVWSSTNGVSPRSSMNDMSLSIVNRGLAAKSS